MKTLQKKITKNTTIDTTGTFVRMLATHQIIPSVVRVVKLGEEGGGWAEGEEM